MKKICLVIILILIAGLCFAGRIQQHHMMIIGQEQGAAAGISDDFSGDLSKWTQDSGSWSITDPGDQLAPTADNTGQRIRYTDSNTSSVTQYAKIEFDVIGHLMGITFRVPATSGPMYAVINDDDASIIRWSCYSDYTTKVSDVDDVALFDMSSGDYLGVTVTGTGNDTVVRVWINPTGDAPSAADNWGGAATGVMTDNPDTAADTGKGFGLVAVETEAFYFDNFSGGSL